MLTRNIIINTTISSKSESFTPHLTVATIIEKDNKFLFVEEYVEGRVVLNQPAGHLEAGESLIDAAIRETYEETGWKIDVTGVLNINLYHSAHNNITYHRTTFIGKTLKHDAEAKLDNGIIRALWLTLEELNARKEDLRSPLVSLSVEQYLSESHYPLALVKDYR